MKQRASKVPGKKIIPDNSASVVSINSREDIDLNFLPCFIFCCFSFWFFIYILFWFWGFGFILFCFVFLKRWNTAAPSHSGLCQQGSFATARAWSHISADQTTVSPTWAQVVVHFQPKQFLSLSYSTASGNFMLSVIWFPCWSCLGSVGRTVLDSLPRF